MLYYAGHLSTALGPHVRRPPPRPPPPGGHEPAAGLLRGKGQEGGGAVPGGGKNINDKNFKLLCEKMVEGKIINFCAKRWWRAAALS